MCFITLMLVDSYEKRNIQIEYAGYSNTEGKLPPMVGELFVAMKRQLKHIAANHQAKTSSENTRGIYHKGVPQTEHSANWTELIREWRANVTYERKYNYMINNENLCKDLTDQKMVILIYSAIKNSDKRISLRNTWADSRIANKKRFTVVFLLGKTAEKSDQDLINAESEKYNDLVQGDFLDLYHNLPDKGLFGFQWVMDYCQNARVVLKVDDDVFVDIFKLLDKYADETYESGYLGCQVREIGYSPISREGRWALDEKYFPGQTYFNFRHCNGYFVMLSPDIVRKILELSAKTEPRLWLDDVYLFGLVPSKIESLNLTQLWNNLSAYEDDAMNCFGDVKRCHLFMGYTYNNKSFEKLWKLAILNSYEFVEKYGNQGYIFIKSIKLST